MAMKPRKMKRGGTATKKNKVGMMRGGMAKKPIAMKRGGMTAKKDK